MTTPTATPLAAPDGLEVWGQSNENVRCTTCGRWDFLEKNQRTTAFLATWKAAHDCARSAEQRKAALR